MEGVKVKTLTIILALLIAFVVWQMTQHYHLNKDAWECTESRVLYEIDEDGGIKLIKSCVEYKRN